MMMLALRHTSTNSANTPRHRSASCHKRQCSRINSVSHIHRPGRIIKDVNKAHSPNKEMRCYIAVKRYPHCFVRLADKYIEVGTKRNLTALIERENKPIDCVTGFILTILRCVDSLVLGPPLGAWGTGLIRRKLNM